MYDQLLEPGRQRRPQHPRTTHCRTDGSREDCCLCSRVKRVSMQRGWEGFRPVTTPPGHFRCVRRVQDNAISKDFGRARSPSWCSLRWGFNDRLDKISARDKSSCKNDRPPARPCVLCKCSSKLLAPSLSLHVLLSSDDTALQARPPDEDGEEDLERPDLRQRTSAPDVDVVPVDGPVVVLSDQVEERGRRRDSWDRVKRRLRSAFNLLRALVFVEVQD